MAFYSSGVEYGIHSLTCMIDAKGNKREMTVREIAQLQGVPFDYLAKIFTKLSKAGLIISTEGKGGGVQLARSPELITLLDIVQAIDQNKSIFQCKEVRERFVVFNDAPPKWACSGICGIHAVMKMAQERMEDVLAQYSILDISRSIYVKAPESFAIEVEDWISKQR